MTTAPRVSTRISPIGGSRRPVCLHGLLGICGLLAAVPAYAAYTPAQILTAYGFNEVQFGSTPADGLGETIAIIDPDNEPDIGADLTTFDTQFGLPAPPNFSVVGQSASSGLPATTATGSAQLEICLDVEWAHAIAPGANIVLVEANSSSQVDLATANAYAKNMPDVSVISMSFGAPDGIADTAEDYRYSTPAGHQGITFVAGSGDNGTVFYPASSPNVLAVGGTSLTLNANGTYVSETTWNNSYGSSGGGISNYEPEPDYQLVAQQTGGRTTPDVAYDADPNTGFDTYVDGVGWVSAGGTSAGAPQWAALIAIADQGRALNGLGTLDSSSMAPTGTMPMLYALYDTPFYSEAFNDITTGENQDGFAAGTGYDEVTGLGSPEANFLIPYLAGDIAIPEPSTAALLLAMLLPLMSRRPSRAR